MTRALLALALLTVASCGASPHRSEVEVVFRSGRAVTVEGVAAWDFYRGFLHLHGVASMGIRPIMASFNADSIAYVRRVAP